MSDEIKDEGFSIKDNRSSQKTDEDLNESSSATGEDPESSAEREVDSGSTATGTSPASIDFPTFILSLTSSAFYHMGEIADPQTGQKSVDLSAAKQTIDILVMLKEKTTGNLNAEETQLMDQLTYELQMKFLNKSQEK